MQAGKLDQRVTLERMGSGVDALGQPVGEWESVGTCWASVHPLAGREFIAAQAAQSEVTAKITMRYRPGITSADRVVHGAVVYGIESVIQVRSDRRELQLMCKAVA